MENFQEYFQKCIKDPVKHQYISLREKCPYSKFSGPYSVQMREDTAQKNFEYGHFSRIVYDRAFCKNC